MRRREFIAGLGAAAWPRGAWAQQAAVPIVGILSTGSGEDEMTSIGAFTRGLRQEKRLEMVRPGQAVLVSGRLQSFLDTFDQGADTDWLG